jgi:hypothetical protein
VPKGPSPSRIAGAGTGMILGGLRMLRFNLSGSVTGRPAPLSLGRTLFTLGYRSGVQSDEVPHRLAGVVRILDRSPLVGELFDDLQATAVGLAHRG